VTWTLFFQLCGLIVVTGLVAVAIVQEAKK
jgi:hypothetical protein